MSGYVALTRSTYLFPPHSRHRLSENQNDFLNGNVHGIGRYGLVATSKPFSGIGQKAMNVYLSQRLQKLRQSERGSAAVEFALILPILASLVFGAIDFGRMLWFQEVLVNATREGTRQGTLFFSGNGQAEIQAVVAQALNNGGVPTTGLNVGVNGVGAGTGNPLTVTSTIPWQFFVIDSLIPGITTNQLTASVTMMNE